MYHANIDPKGLGRLIDAMFNKLPDNAREEFRSSVLIWLLNDASQYVEGNATYSVIQKVASLLEDRDQDEEAWDDAFNEAWHAYTISPSRAAAAVAVSAVSLGSPLHWSVYWSAMATPSASRDEFAKRLLEFAGTK